MNHHLLAFALGMERRRHTGGKGSSWGSLLEGAVREGPLKRAGMDANPADVPPPAKAGG